MRNMCPACSSTILPPYMQSTHAKTPTWCGWAEALDKAGTCPQNVAHHITSLHSHHITSLTSHHFTHITHIPSLMQSHILAEFVFSSHQCCFFTSSPSPPFLPWMMLTVSTLSRYLLKFHPSMCCAPTWPNWRWRRCPPTRPLWSLHIRTDFGADGDTVLVKRTNQSINPTNQPINPINQSNQPINQSIAIDQSPSINQSIDRSIQW